MSLRLLVLLLTVIFVSCNSQPSSGYITSLTQSLDKSNKLLLENNNMVGDALQERLRDPVYFRKAGIWTPKADSFVQLSRIFMAEVSAIKKDLRTMQENGVHRAGSLSDSTQKRLFEQLTAWINATDRLVIPDRFNDEAYIKARVTAEIKKLRKYILTDLGLKPDSNLQVCVSPSRWLSAYFDDTSPVQAIAMLTELENNVIQADARFLDYCLSNVNSILYCGYTSFRVIATLSHGYVKQGQKIEVYAGMGSFDLQSKPVFLINGKHIKVDGDYVATCSIVAKGAPGKHIIPLEVEYVKPDGSRAKVSKNLEYIIAE